MKNIPGVRVDLLDSSPARSLTLKIDAAHQAKRRLPGPEHLANHCDGCGQDGALTSR